MQSTEASQDGDASALQRPYGGLRVVDLSNYIAGPHCAMLLGDLGASVMKVERATSGDESRQWGRRYADGFTGAFVSVNRNKQSRVANLRDDTDLHAVQEMCASADVIIESFPPGVGAGYGLDHRSTLARNPDVIHCTISGYGAETTRSHLGAYDGILQAYAGIMALNGLDGTPYVRIPVSAIDLLCGTNAFGAVTAALAVRGRVGGQHVDASLFDAGLTLLGGIISDASFDDYVPTRRGGEVNFAFPYGVYETGEGAVSLAVGNDETWRRFCLALDLDELGSDRRYAFAKDRLQSREELRPLVLRRFADLSANDVVAKCEEHRVPCAAVRTPDEVLRDDFTAERDGIWWLDVAGQRVPVAASPLRLSKTPPAMCTEPAPVGASVRTWTGWPSTPSLSHVHDDTILSAGGARFDKRV